MASIYFLSSGKLYGVNPQGGTEEIVSAFGNEVVQRSLELHQRNEWKRSGRGAKFMSGGMLWGLDAQNAQAARVHISGVTRGPQSGELWYSLDTDAAGGLFHYRPAPSGERRVFHKEHFRAKDLDRHPTAALLAFSLDQPNGTSHLSVLTGDGPHFEDITEGDSVDEAPSWVPGKPKTLVFQSAGVGRNEKGFAMGLGPYSIQELDLESGNQETLLQNDSFDYLLPHKDEAGNLFVIRRPYEENLVRRSWKTVLKDILFFPWRMIEAVFHFLNFFSMTFAKKPLTMAGGPKVEGADAQTVLLRGRVLDVQHALSQQKRTGEAPALVPKSWVLIKRSPNGEETVLADYVAGFDLAPNGDIVMSNGNAVFLLKDGIRPEKIAQARIIEHVIAVG